MTKKNNSFLFSLINEDHVTGYFAFYARVKGEREKFENTYVLLLKLMMALERKLFWHNLVQGRTAVEVD